MNHVPNPRAVAGNNLPPFEQSRQEIEDLFAEVKNFLDGAPIATQGQADAVGLLAQKIRAAIKTADERRTVENKQFDDGKAEVQARYNPLIADTKTTKGKGPMALEVCKQALALWLAKVDEAKRAEAERLRAEAERRAQEAAEALAASRSNTADLESREEAERAIEQAAKAERLANKAEKSTAQASGGAGRAIGLRTVYSAEIVDISSAVWHFLATCRDEMLPAIQRLADDAVRSAGKNAESLSIPGVVIHAEKKAV